jgi:hypothetical protein
MFDSLDLGPPSNVIHYAPVISRHWNTSVRDFDVLCTHKLVFPLKAVVVIYTAGVLEPEHLLAGARRESFRITS